ncbi:DUF6263 family protein [Moheibacter sediminis]|uniref:Lipoprotein n=1 Tax=Moheibacter sediminis TaxID=1434700 RepID=A0A1W1ZC07_9FLAO|nr:DUF6263 family protein [Moheibacter sediminis]SMC45751.1 hypothetical protein SAMN06296427_102356 [Moheibacter sediminis]
MKKSLIILAAFALIASCKKENEKVVGTNENGEKLVVNEAGDTVVFSTENVKEIPNEEAALQKAEDGTYTFRYNLKKGETYPFSLKINTNQSLSDGTQSQKMTSSRTTDVSYFVEDVVDNKFKLKATFKAFSEEFTSPEGEKMFYNTGSTQPADKDIAQSWKIYKAITGETFQMEVDNKGKVLNVKGLDKVSSSVQSKLKNDFTAEEQKMIGELLKGTLNSEFIKMQFEETLNIFPDKSMKIGENWEDSQNISEGPIKGTNKVTRTFKSIDGNIATITVDGVQNVNGKETQQGVTMSMSNNATLKGSIDLDLGSGWIKKVDLTKSETVKQTMEGQGQKKTMTQTSTTKTSVN